MKVALILLSLLACFVQPVQEKQAEKPTEQHNKVTQQNPIPIPPAQQETINNYYLSQQKAGNWHDAIAPPTWSNWFLGLVGIGAIVAAICTFRGVERQVRIMQTQTKAIRRQGLSMRRQTTILRNSLRASVKNGKAALLSARAMISAERALIEVDLMEASTEETDPETGDRFVDYGNEFRYGIKITNHGRTVARVVSYKVWSDCFASNFDRERFSYSSLVTRHMLLGRDQAERIADINLGDLFSDWDSIHSRTKTGMLRVDVRYEDVIQAKEHETSAIFRYSVEDEEPKRLPEYNTYT